MGPAAVIRESKEMYNPVYIHTLGFLLQFEYRNDVYEILMKTLTPYNRRENNNNVIRDSEDNQVHN
jgi:hypothetical protein